MSFQHAWNVSPQEAVAIQKRLADHVVSSGTPTNITRVAGVDVGFESNGEITRAAVAVLSFPELELVESAISRCATTFPYIPGLLSFREIPAVLEAIAKLTRPPELILCDGQGTAHPRRLGIASHLGLLLNLPTIGVGKSRLAGHARLPVSNEKGAWQLLFLNGDRVGAILRTRPGVKPLYISPGHLVGFDEAIEWTLLCTTRYRLPETTRWAHRIASGPPLRRPRNGEQTSIAY